MSAAWGPFGEAMCQTVPLVGFPLVAAFGLLLILFGRRFFGPRIDGNALVVCVSGLGFTIAAYFVLRWIVRDLRDAAESFSG